MLNMAIKELPELHDSHLVGVSYLPDRAIQLEFQAPGTRKTVLLTGVVHFFCTGMLEANIVESVELIDAEDVSSDELTFFVEKEARGQSVESLRRTIASKRLSMVLLSPSYGAELGCACSGAVIS
jgi:hypothetical protein